jgi:diamine N-acetyltransferase
MPLAIDKVVITLREITATTVRAVTSLRLAPEQEGYVASNAVSIAQAHFARDAWFRSIHADEELIGFAMLRDGTLLPPKDAKPEVSLWRFMVAHEYQRRGYGREALSLLVSHARSRPGSPQ